MANDAEAFLRDWAEERRRHQADGRPAWMIAAVFAWYVFVMVVCYTGSALLQFLLGFLFGRFIK